MNATLHLLKGDLPEVEGFDGELSVENMRRLLGEITALRDKLTGAGVTINSQAGIIGKQVRQLEQADPTTHPQHAEIAALLDRWKAATGHPKARRSKDRIEVVKARLKDGYEMAHLELAVDGIAAFPFVIQGSRRREGNPDQRHDALTIALKSGENVERFAVLGYRARQGRA